MKIEDIKFGTHVLDVLQIPRFFADIAQRTSLDHKTLQRTLDKLRKHGHAVKSKRGEWMRSQ